MLLQILYNIAHTYTGTDQENGVRLNDKLNKNQLYIDLLNDWMTVKIGNFEITLDFELFGIYVTN
jgi:hypothetical protein